MSPSREHRASAPSSVRCAVVTVSDTRTLDTDTGGAALAAGLEAAGHCVRFRQITPDDPGRIRPLLISLCTREDLDAVLLTGGTGIAPRDQTYEAVQSVLTKTLPGYGELFRWLSYQEIGPAALLSRTVGGLRGRTLILTMPGSPAAVKLALEKLILPELPHLVGEARK